MIPEQPLAPPQSLASTNAQEALPAAPAPATKRRSPRNQTLRTESTDAQAPSSPALQTGIPIPEAQLRNQIFCADTFALLPHFPPQFVDLLFLDPPYNLTKHYHGSVFRKRSANAYSEWFTSLLHALKPTLKPTASLYVCADWQTSLLIGPLLNQHFHLRNRITWAREKGRGAAANWKSVAEDIWFCTNSHQFHFNVHAVLLRKKVRAPYRTQGLPKDWREDATGKFRLTHPSNVWTDLTVPFWSMAENTEHPTQKPEKLLARLLLASTRPGDMVLDPFLGSGTTAVVAKKLGRNFLGMEQNSQYCSWALKRLSHAKEGSPIQGYSEGAFCERNPTRD